jgi:hypothetical protein
MEPMSRRHTLAATVAGGLLTASAATAQTVEGIPRVRRRGYGGTDPGPRNPMRDGQNPDMLKSSYYADVSLGTWIAVSPPELLQAHLTLDRQVADVLRMNKTQAVPATFETDAGKLGSPHLRPPAVGDTEKRI